MTKTKNTPVKIESTNRVNLSGTILKYLRVNRTMMSASDIAKGLRKEWHLRFTPTKITKCLSSLKNQGRVWAYKGGTTSTGRSCLRWRLSRTTTPTA